MAAKARIRGKAGRDGSEAGAFANGALLNLDIRCYSATAQVSKDEAAAMLAEGIDPKVMTLTADLLEDKGAIESIRSMRDRVKAYVHRVSMPFPITGFVFVHRNRVPAVVEALRAFKTAFEGAVDELVEDLPELMKSFRRKHPTVFEANQSKYLTPEQLRHRFHFSWSFRILTVPDREMGLLPEDALAEEMEKFRADMRAVRNQAMRAVSQELYERVKTLLEQCSGGRPNQSTINGISSFIDRFENGFRDVVDHATLNNLIREVRELMEGTDAEMLRVDDDFRRLVGERMNEVAEEIEKSNDVRIRPGRKIIRSGKTSVEAK